MSRNRNYQNYYRPQPELEKPIEDTEAKETIEESPVTEDTEAKETIEESLASKEETTFETEITPTEVIQKSAAIVKGAPKVNMRSKASKDALVIAIIPENTSVLILDDTNEYWYLIEVNGGSGYMMSKYLKRI